MGDRMAMLEATLDLMEEGIAVLDEQSRVVYWNQAAATLTGYTAQDMVCLPCPEGLFRVDQQHRDKVVARAEAELKAGLTEGAGISRLSATMPSAEPARTSDPFLERLTLVSIHHKLGHEVPGMLRKVALQDSQASPMGAVLLFYPAEEVDALPRGESGEAVGIEASQAEMEDRLDAAHHQWSTSGMPFGLLWITVDQARSLRKTHGKDACEAMLRAVEDTLLRQMKPAEAIGRWGDNEFLIIAHERSAQLLTDHARRLAGLARIVDFRWWGDRIGLTLSIGTSFAIEADTLPCLLHRARQAMRTSEYAGGNHVTEARGDTCFQS
ncbi:MAG TPA: diguanylate cyclase [Acidobacteriaceae bacterium]